MNPGNLSNAPTTCNYSMMPMFAHRNIHAHATCNLGPPDMNTVLVTYTCRSRLQDLLNTVSSGPDHKDERDYITRTIRTWAYENNVKLTWTRFNIVYRCLPISLVFVSFLKFWGFCFSRSRCLFCIFTTFRVCTIKFPICFEKLRMIHLLRVFVAQ